MLGSVILRRPWGLDPGGFALSGVLGGVLNPKGLSPAPAQLRGAAAAAE
jgi:hypothetical protein